MSAPKLVLPESMGSSQMLRAIDEALVKYTALIAVRKKDAKEIKELIERHFQLEDEIAQARNAMFVLLYEKIHCREQIAADAFVAALSEELKPLQQENAGKEKTQP